MNFLAHFLLSGNNRNIIIGNYLGDFVKGRKIEELSTEIQKGIILHREIDQFTDNHPQVKETVQLLRPYFQKYSGVVSDIFFDHFLARHWSKYHQKELHVFAESIYQILSSHKSKLPERAIRFYNYMIAHNILLYYREIEGIQYVMDGMAHRAKYDSNFEKSVEVLENHYQEIEKYFLNFMPQLVRHSEKVKSNFLESNQR